MGFKSDGRCVGVGLVWAHVIRPRAITLSMCGVLAFRDLVTNPFLQRVKRRKQERGRTLAYI